MRGFSWILRKDLAVFFSDPKGAAMVIVVPLVLGLLMGTIFDPGEGPTPIRVLVVDDDGGPAVARLITAFDEEPSIEVERTSAVDARDRVARGKVGVALHIPAGSDARLKPASLFATGERGAITMWVDPSQRVEADIVGGLLTKGMMETTMADIGDPAAQREMFSDLRATMGSAEERPELAKFLDQGVAFSAESGTGAGKKSGGLQPPLAIATEEIVAAGPTAGFNSYAHTFAGMLMQFLLFSSSNHAKTLMAERAAGTLDRVRMTRARPWEILLGSAAGVAVIALISTAVIFGAGALFFGIELRSGILAFALAALGQAMFVGAFSLLLAGLARSEKQIDAFATLIVLFLCFISGAWVPTFMLPTFFQQIGPFVPTRWVLDAMAGATWRGLGVAHALQCFGVLSGFSAVFAGIGLRRFKWS